RWARSGQNLRRRRRRRWRSCTRDRAPRPRSAAASSCFSISRCARRRGRLTAATSFHVVVPAGTRALGGASLAQPFVFDFETPAPAVVSSEPAPGSDGEEPDVQLRLRFNQPVSAAALERAGQLRALRGSRAQRLEFSARPRADHPNELELAPRQPLPLGSRIELRVPAGLRGSEGPRPLAADYVLAFDTYAPLRVVAIDC